MSEVLIQESTLSAIGDAIRSKTGSSNLMSPAEMVTAIDGITTGDSNQWEVNDCTINWGSVTVGSTSSNISAYNAFSWILPANFKFGAVFIQAAMIEGTSTLTTDYAPCRTVYIIWPTKAELMTNINNAFEFQRIRTGVYYYNDPTIKQISVANNTQLEQLKTGNTDGVQLYFTLGRAGTTSDTTINFGRATSAPSNNIRMFSFTI